MCGRSYEELQEGRHTAVRCSDVLSQSETGHTKRRFAELMIAPATWVAMRTVAGEFGSPVSRVRRQATIRSKVRAHLGTFAVEHERCRDTGTAKNLRPCHALSVVAAHDVILLGLQQGFGIYTGRPTGQDA